MLATSHRSGYRPRVLGQVRAESDPPLQMARRCQDRSVAFEGNQGRPRAVLSPMVRPGDRVRLVSPSSSPSDEWLATSIETLTGWGLRVEVGDHALDQWGYMAGRDQHRLADLNEAFRDRGVRAVIATRGGAGAYRIAGDIDFGAVRADPKPLVGFSDITNLHLALWQHCQLATIHGCLAGSDATRAVRQLLMSSEGLRVQRDRHALSAAIEVPGQAGGPLLGGNLREVAGSIGVGLPDLDGAILFLEEQRLVGLGQIDRNLTQLFRSGSLDGVVGIALGSFAGFDDYADRGWTLVDVLHDRLGGLGVPVLGGLPLGHGGVGADGSPDQSAVTLGATCVLDTAAGTLTVGPCVCE